MDYDVVIVGAGPTGATAAKKLAESGATVLLIDKRKFPADKPCGGGLPNRVIKRFPYIEPFIDAISYGSTTYSMGKKYAFEMKRKSPLLYTVSRKYFDNELVKLALSAGAEIKTETLVSNISINPSEVTIKLASKEKIASKILIGADGTRSLVAEKTGLRDKKQPICRCLVAEEYLSEKQIEKYYSKNRMVSLFIKTQGIAGYGWVFPKKNHVNIGLGEFESALPHNMPRANLKNVFSGFIEDLKSENMLPSNFEITNLKGGTLPIFPLKKTYTDRVLLCGDAAGFINPITGEGVYYAMASGEIAASVIQKALQNQSYDQKSLSIYQRLWWDDFGKDLRLLGRFNNQWGKSSEKIVRLLTKDKVFAKLIVGVTGGSISAREYRNKLILRFIYVLLKDKITK
ncbi:MAG: NAD(P)/FAD-dependent oxidoreductase [Candidatus Thermoplasmatota archaeon]|nr:NAD(P)/FAD-dependent oxidoreductase [Candidatus Thermoplasmatota archaeon]MBU1941812.1 NAD(P)/FAD-dependent oxidoreductase [Candidatus Thermoplasmatota archaeon]